MRPLKKILVTGGAGFLGSHLCARLLSEGHRVVCLDNLYTGSKGNLIQLLDNPRFEVVSQDVTLPLKVEAEEIYNLACPASPIHYQKDPIRTLKTSILGALNVLDLASRCGARILQASTSEVYGDPQVHPQKENYWGHVNPIGIRACYDEGKRCAETLFFDSRRQQGLSIKVARIFNTYGPNMDPDDGRVVSNFIAQALRNEPLTVYGDGHQTRSFCYVDDMIDALTAFMTSSEELTGPVNLGNPIEYRVIDLAALIIDLTGSKSKITLKPLPMDDPVQRRPDIGLAMEKLGWRPKIGLVDGLKQTIAYFRGISSQDNQA